VTFAVIGLAFALVPHGSELRMPDGDRVWLEIDIDGKPAVEGWNGFLDAWFDYFDRDGDGILNAEETARMRNAKVGLTRGTGADNPNTLSRAEWKRLCRANFAPVVWRIEPPTPDASRIDAALFRALDADRDGKLSRRELADAPRLLKYFDDDEDDALTPAEILAGSATATPVGESRPSVRLDPWFGAQPGMVARVEIGGGAKPSLRWASKGRWDVAVRAGTSPIDAGETTRFYLGLFSAAAGDKPSVAKADLEGDLGQRALLDLFDAADRDGDGKLTQAELERFLALATRGAMCQTRVTVSDRGRNLFDALDANRDGRLDLRELARAGSIDPDRLPLQVRIDIRRGTASPAFGPVRLARAKDAANKTPAPQKGDVPRWFTAMDRNGDGVVSPREFLGPPEAFRKLDANGDGVIDADEARRAESSRTPD
jgi:Ca2+-binding EF-hand superfamily protein